MEKEQLRGIRSLDSLLKEDAILTIGIYGVLILYCLKIIPFWGLQALMLIYVIRVFNLRHERAHLPSHTESKWTNRFSEWLEVYHTPYQEPFSEKRNKHMLHHRAHTGHTLREVQNNAHGLLDSSLVRALLSSIFYHEVMFILDIRRDHKISKERINSLFISTSMIALTIWLIGISNFMAFFLSYRLSSFVAWFSFSYILHIKSLYVADLGHRLPLVFKRGFELILGQGSVTAIFHHQFHHKRPSQFYKF